jgi:predicted ribosome quality control (RQC) complex YloA/Tae2 family protein
MPYKKKLVDMDVVNIEWLKRTSKELGIYEREIIDAVFAYARTHDVMEGYRQKAVANQLEKTLDRLTSQATEIAALKEKAQSQLRKLQPTDGND